MKRLDSDMEIKVNSKENQSVFQAIPMIFEGFSEQIKGFPKDAKPYATANPGVKGDADIATPGSKPGGKRSRGTSGAPHVLLDRHAAKARLKRRASLDALWRLAMTERRLSFEASDRAGWINLVQVRSKSFSRSRRDAQIRPSLPCNPLRLALPPLGDLRVVALEVRRGFAVYTR